MRAQAGDTFSIITTPANEMMEDIHNSKKRMPLIIDEQDRGAWLTAETEKEIKELMMPFDQTKMIAHPISKLISNRKEDSNVADVLDLVVYDDLDLRVY